MFKSNFVVSIKSDGKVLREKGDCAYLAFGSEYSIKLHNLENRLAVVKVEVDGKSVTDNKGILVQSNSFFELDGFIKDYATTNKFKFIERTKEIEEYRGIGDLDGLIKVEVRFQKEKPVFKPNYVYIKSIDQWPTYYPSGSDPNITYTYTCQSLGADGNSGTVSWSCSNETKSRLLSVNSDYEYAKDAGITVKGAPIHETFTPVYIDDLEDTPHILVLRLMGYKKDHTKVETPVFVTTKLECPTCGLKNDSSANYCSRCGTYIGRL